MDYDIDIAVEYPKWEQLDFDITNVTIDVLKHVFHDQLAHKDHIEISIVLVDDPFIQELNHKYRGKNKPTNVLSFPITEFDDIESKAPFISLGDVIVSYDTINSEALDQHKSLKDHYTHMLIHGCLHLMHYDHTEDDEAQAMEALEIKLLDEIGIKNPYEIV